MKWTKNKVTFGEAKQLSLKLNIWKKLFDTGHDMNKINFYTVQT